VAWGLAIALLLTIACVEKARRVWPMNMVLLGAFTCAQAFLVGTMTAQYSEQAVIIAFAVTSAAVIGISIFAINTKVMGTAAAAAASSCVRLRPLKASSRSRRLLPDPARARLLLTPAPC
jgi:FtsH-binding integral membrane protein